MKSGRILFMCSLVLALGIILVDRIYVVGLHKRIVLLEKERIAASNQLATAKIVQENLNHVRELVFENMEFGNQSDSGAFESRFFEFITQSVSDLKLRLVALEPSRPNTKGAQTEYSYKLVIEGDFFSFGELCAKLENSRRIITLERFSVQQLADKFSTSIVTQSFTRGITATLVLNTYRIKKRTM